MEEELAGFYRNSISGICFLVFKLRERKRNQAYGSGTLSLVYTQGNRSWIIIWLLADLAWDSILFSQSYGLASLHLDKEKGMLWNPVVTSFG